jgi:uncharacterized protein YukE
MPSKNEPVSSDDIFRKLETILGELRTATAAPPESWAKKTFKGSRDTARQTGLLVDALSETLKVLRAAVTNQETRFDEIAREMAEVRATSENLDAFRERSDRLETELRSAAANVRALQERSAALEMALAERTQHLLDEQRVCIRQLSLQASEEAVLADRARRATELKLEELARRIAPPPA